MNNKLYLCAIFTATILSSSANADFSDWYKKATSNEESTQQVPAQQHEMCFSLHGGRDNMARVYSRRRTLHPIRPQ